MSASLSFTIYSCIQKGYIRKGAAARAKLPDTASIQCCMVLPILAARLHRSGSPSNRRGIDLGLHESRLLYVEYLFTAETEYTYNIR